MFYGWSDTLNDSTGELKPKQCNTCKGADAFEHALSARGVASTSCLLVRTQAARDIGGFNECLIARNDYYFICLIASKYQIEVCRKVTLTYHIEHGSLKVTQTEAHRRSKYMYHCLHAQTFSCELSKRPSIFANIYKDISVLAMQNSFVKESISAFLFALKARPIDLSNIRHTLRLAKIFVFYVTPISQYRTQSQAIQRTLGLRRE